MWSASCPDAFSWAAEDGDDCIVQGGVKKKQVSPFNKFRCSAVPLFEPWKRKQQKYSFVRSLQAAKLEGGTHCA
jgi:hypothetical protein